MRSNGPRSRDNASIVTPSPAGTVRLRLVDAILDRAVRSVLDHADLVVADDGPMVSDRLPADLLLVHSLARPCLDGVVSVERGEVRGLLTVDDIDAIASVLDCLRAGCVVVAQAAREKQRPLTALTPRQLEILRRHPRRPEQWRDRREGPCVRPDW